MNVCILSEIYFSRTDVSERIDVDKTTASKEQYLSLQGLLKLYSFKFQPNV